MKNIKHFILLSLFATILFACNSENKDWKATQEEGTVNAYAEFYEKYPDSEYKSEIKNFLIEFIEENSTQLYVLYDNFKLRQEPNLDAEIVEKMKEGTKVELFESNRDYQKIEINGYTTNIDWYDVKTENGKTGWVYGAGLGYSKEMFKACKIILQQFPEENLIPLQYCETNYWNEVTIKENEIDKFIEHKKIFPNGIYSIAATEEIINKSFPKLSIDKFEKFEIPFDEEKLIIVGKYFKTKPFFYCDVNYITELDKIPDNELKELSNKTFELYRTKESLEFDYYYGKLIFLNSDFFALTVIMAAKKDNQPVDLAEIMFVFKNIDFQSNTDICYTNNNENNGFSNATMFKDAEGKIYMKPSYYSNKKGNFRFFDYKAMEPESKLFYFDETNGVFTETTADNLMIPFKLKTPEETLNSYLEANEYTVEKIIEIKREIYNNNQLEVVKFGQDNLYLKRFYDGDNLVRIELLFEATETDARWSFDAYYQNNQLIYYSEFSNRDWYFEGISTTKGDYNIYFNGPTIIDYSYQNDLGVFYEHRLDVNIYLDEINKIKEIDTKEEFTGISSDWEMEFAVGDDFQG